MYFLVPRESFDQSATLWVAAFDEPPGLPLGVRSDQQVAVTQPDSWREWPQGQRRIRYGTAVATGLTPRRRYSFSLVRDGDVVAQASLTTLPKELPLLADEKEKPFTVMLASCFSWLEDEEATVGNTFFHMPAPARPDIKLLSGDQVYLDSPWYRFLTETHCPTQLSNIFLDHYTRTWGQREGFARLLGEGANYFCSDDHEFWNNAPNRAAYIQDTWFGNRQTWWDLAASLYRVFQTDQTVTSFTVPPVSFLIADTRINRSADRTTFMLPQDLQRIGAWVEGLTGPGVLVIGQPLLQTSTGFFKGHFGDWNLPDFEQYQQLTQIVAGAMHSLVILSGDVHYGRIASSTLRSGFELIEIISSPLSLVDQAAKGTWVKAPEAFPAERPARRASALLARSTVMTASSFAPVDNHFLTLEFTKRGAGALMRVRYWPIFRGGVAPRNPGETVWERTLV